MESSSQKRGQRQGLLPGSCSLSLAFNLCPVMPFTNIQEVPAGRRWSLGATAWFSATVFSHLWPAGSLPTTWVPLRLKPHLGPTQTTAPGCFSQSWVSASLIATRARTLQCRTFQLCFVPDATHRKATTLRCLLISPSEGNCTELSTSVCCPGPHLQP